jgi:hypothetical protein
MYIVLVGAGFTHGFQAPVSSRGSHQFNQLFMEITEGAITGFATECVTTNLH